MDFFFFYVWKQVYGGSYAGHTTSDAIQMLQELNQ